MAENSFASFKPIISFTDNNKESLQNYYAANGLVPDNDYMKNYLGLENPLDTPILKTTTSSKTPSDISKILSDVVLPSSLSNTPTAEATDAIKVPTQTVIGTPSTNPIKRTLLTDAAIDKLGRHQKASEVINFFVKKGLTREQAAGIAGNLHNESGFNTKIIGDQGTSYGLAQWHSERWTNMKKFTAARGLPQHSFTGQLEFLWNELNTGEQGALTALKKTRTPVEAARTFAHKFERMKTYNKSRELDATKFYNS